MDTPDSGAEMPRDEMTTKPDGGPTKPFVPFPDELVPVHIVRRRNRFVIEATPAEETPFPGMPTHPLLLHMPNTGRMSELLTPGTLGLAAPDGGEQRKTAGTLLLVQYEGRWVSVDARMPNRLFAQGMAEQFLRPFNKWDAWRAEVPWGKGRIDFKLWKSAGRAGERTARPTSTPSVREGSASALAEQPALNGRSVLVETKSCNLVVDGVALFPDAPTERGARHLLDLADAVNSGHRAAVVWFVQRDDARRLAPHRQADPVFGEAFDKALARGVEAYAYRCRVTPRGIEVLDSIPVDAAPAQGVL